MAVRRAVAEQLAANKRRFGRTKSADEHVVVFPAARGVSLVTCLWSH